MCNSADGMWLGERSSQACEVEYGCIMRPFQVKRRLSVKLDSLKLLFQNFMLQSLF
jgi:hypothetical protein